MKPESRLISQDTVRLPQNSNNSKPQKILICLGRSCRKYSSEKVFYNFKQNLPPDNELIAVGCLGQCGNGPMVLIEVESDPIWYSEVHPDEVAIIVKQHLIGKSPVKEMLYPKFHSDQYS